MDRELIETIRTLAGTKLKDEVYTFDAEVESVDLDARTCVCSLISDRDGNTIPDVRLMAAVDDGVLIVPAIGSTVTLIVSKYGDPYVSSYSEVEKLIFMGGEFGGLLKLKETTEKLNALENDINALKKAFASWVVLPGDGGAALKAVAAAWSGTQLTITKTTDLENPNITQG